MSSTHAQTLTIAHGAAAYNVVRVSLQARSPPCVLNGTRRPAHELARRWTAALPTEEASPIMPLRTQQIMPYHEGGVPRAIDPRREPARRWLTVAQGEEGRGQAWKRIGGWAAW